MLHDRSDTDDGPLLDSGEEPQAEQQRALRTDADLMRLRANDRRCFVLLWLAFFANAYVDKLMLDAAILCIADGITGTLHMPQAA